VDWRPSSDGKTVLARVYATEERLLDEATRVGVACKLNADSIRAADMDENARLQALGLGFAPRGKEQRHACLSALCCCCIRIGAACCSGDDAPADDDAPPHLPREQLAIPPLPASAAGRLASCLCPCLCRRAPADPYAGLYAPFLAAGARDPRRGLYKRLSSTGTFLANTDVLRLLLGMLEAPTSEGAAGLGPLGRLVRRGRLRGWFPGRHARREAALAREWGVCALPCCQPLDRVRDVYGARVALYFALVSFLAVLLAPAALAGAAAFVNQLTAGAPSAVGWAPLYALLVIASLAVATKMWVRRERRLAARWGLLDSGKSTSVRVEFRLSAQWRRSPVTGKPAYWRSPAGAGARRTCSLACTASALVAAALITLSTFLARVGLGVLEDRGLVEPRWSGHTASVVSAVAITLTQMAYASLAVFLTRLENAETGKQHETSLVLKQGAFNFFNVRQRPRHRHGETPGAVEGPPTAARAFANGTSRLPALTAAPTSPPPSAALPPPPPPPPQVTFALLWTAFGQNRAALLYSGRVEPCSSGPTGEADCLAQLQAQVGALLATKFVLGNVTEVLLPWVMEHWRDLLCCRWRRACCRRPCWWCACGLGGVPDRLQQPSDATVAPAGTEAVGTAAAPADDEEAAAAAAAAAVPGPERGEGGIPAPALARMEADALLTAFDYAPEMHEVMAVLTISTLFVVAFPLAPLVALVFLATERLVDADKLLRAASRPVPDPQPDMGPWVTLLSFVARSAVVVNAAVVLFTDGPPSTSGLPDAPSSFFGSLSTTEDRLVAFIVVAAAALTAVGLFETMVPDEPHDVAIFRARQEYLVDKHLRGVKDPLVTYDGRDLTDSEEL